MKYRFETKFLLPTGKTSSFEDISVSERFFMGGETTVRGCSPFSIGPLGIGHEPIGGMSSGLISFEFSQELHKLIDAFIFADAGMLTREIFTWDTFASATASASGCTSQGSLRSPSATAGRSTPKGRTKSAASSSASEPSSRN